MDERLAALNIVLGLVGFTWLLVRTSRRRGEYPYEVLLILAALIAVFFGLLVTSVAMFEAEETLGVTALVISAVKAFALYVLWTTKATKYRTGIRSAAGNPGADQNRNV